MLARFTRHLTLPLGLLALATAQNVCAVTLSPVVQTQYGSVQGETINQTHRYLGLPYAAAPIGQLRWKAPQAPNAWTGIRMATQSGFACPQIASQYSKTPSHEDCLNLNVYTPANTSTNRPVIVWIHPGSLTMGSGSDYDASYLAQKSNAVVVTINYRLGVLGFLSTQETQQESSSANYGIQDQQQALRWVTNNIQAFGGDKQRITLMGASAGSASTCVHLASPGSAGLFHRAILQSGPCSMFGNKSLADAKALADSYASKVNCPTGAGQLSCLRAKDTKTLVSAAGDGLNILGENNPWTPVVDGVTLPRKLTDMIRDGAIQRVPVLIGTAADEGRYFVFYTFHQKLGRAMTLEDYKSAAEIMTGSAFNGSLSRTLYPASSFDSIDNAMSSLLTDSGFACPALTDARRLSRHTPVYTYEFTDQQAPAVADPFFSLGAYHTGELQYLFGEPVFSTAVTKSMSTEQKDLSDKMLRYWGAFVSKGDPNVDTLPKWNRFSELTVPFMNLAPAKVGMQVWGDYVKTHRCLAWTLLLSTSGQD